MLPTSVEEYQACIQGYREKKRYKEAVQYCRTVLSGLKGYLDEHPKEEEASRYQSAVLVDLSWFLVTLGRTKQAQRAVERATSITLRIGGPMERYLSLMHLCEYHRTNGDIEGQRNCLVNAIFVLLDDRQRPLVAQALVELSELESENGQGTARNYLRNLGQRVARQRISRRGPTSTPDPTSPAFASPSPPSEQH